MLYKRNPQLNRNGELIHLLSMEGLPRDIVMHILDTASSFASVSDRFIIGRKLSLSIMLNDASEFTGGQFQMVIDSQSMANPITVPHQRGRFVFFPAFLVHRVAPVITGTRKSLVFWALGPKFR